MTATGLLNTADLGPRARELVSTGRELLEAEGPDGLSMRRLGHRLGISAPALYRYFPDKRTLENAIIFDALWESGDVLLQALETGGDTDALAVVCQAYRDWGLAHPYLYCLIWSRPLDRDTLDPVAESHAGEALRRAIGDDDVRVQSVSVFAHGMTSLEIDGRFPPGTDVDALWRHGTAARR